MKFVIKRLDMFSGTKLKIAMLKSNMIHKDRGFIEFSFFLSKTMLAYPDVRRLVDVGDRYDNHPLHIAAQDGYLSIVKVGL